MQMPAYNTFVDVLQAQILKGDLFVFLFFVCVLIHYVLACGAGIQVFFSSSLFFVFF